MKKILLGVLIGLGLTAGIAYAHNGWVRLSSQQDWSIKSDDNQESGMRFHDDEKGVTCWVTTGYSYSGGHSISCLPDSQLK